MSSLCQRIGDTATRTTTPVGYSRLESDLTPRANLVKPQSGRCAGAGTPNEAAEIGRLVGCSFGQALPTRPSRLPRSEAA